MKDSMKKMSKKKKLKLQRRKLHYVVVAMINILFKEDRKFYNGYTKEGMLAMLSERRYRDLQRVVTGL